MKKTTIFFMFFPLAISLALLAGPLALPDIFPLMLNPEKYPFNSVGLQLGMLGLSFVLNGQWIISGTKKLISRHPDIDSLAVIGPIGASGLALTSFMHIGERGYDIYITELYILSAIIMISISSFGDSLMASIRDNHPNMVNDDTDSLNHIALWYIPCTIILCILALFLSYSAGRLDISYVFIMLYCACPVTIKLLYPLLLRTLMQVCRDYGIYIQNPEALSRLPQINVAAFGVLGPLTRCDMIVTDVISQGIPPDSMLNMAATAETYMDDPIAWAIVKEARRRKLKLGTASGTNTLPGMGIEAIINRMVVRVGSEKFLKANGVDVNSEMLIQADKLAAKGRFVVFVNSGRFCRGIIAVNDLAHELLPEDVKDITSMGMDPMVLSGHSRTTARYWAKLATIKNVKAGLSGEDKAKEIAIQQTAGKAVAVLGTKVNTIPAMQAADVAIAPQKAAQELKDTAHFLVDKPSLSMISDTVSMGLAWEEKHFHCIISAFIMNIFMILMGLYLAAMGASEAFNQMIPLISAIISFIGLLFCNYRFNID